MLCEHFVSWHHARLASCFAGNTILDLLDPGVIMLAGPVAEARKYVLDKIQTLLKRELPDFLSQDFDSMIHGAIVPM